MLDDAFFMANPNFGSINKESVCFWLTELEDYYSYIDFHKVLSIRRAGRI
jgi:hypothetical protein